MNARTELAPEGWGLGDVMRPAARGRRRGLPPPVTSWGFGAGLAGPPHCWGAGSPLRGATGRSRAPTGERGARGSRPAASRRGLRALSRAGRGGRAEGGRRSVRPRGELWKPGFAPWGERRAELRAPRQPCLSFPPKLGRPPRERLDSWKSASPEK